MTSFTDAMAVVAAPSRPPASTVHLTADLQAELRQTRQAIEELVALERNKLIELHANYVQQMGQSAAAITALRRSERDADRRKAEDDATAAAHAAQLEALKEEVANLRQEEREVLPVKLRELQALRTELERQLDEKQREEATRRRRKEQEINDLTRGVVFFKYLGLEFEHAGTGGEDEEAFLRLIFTQIDPEDPNRRFAFTVRVDASDAYHVANAAPPVPEEVVAPLLAELNATNDFSGFVRAMRRFFVSTTAFGDGGGGGDGGGDGGEGGGGGAGGGNGGEDM
ncbi:unnamed protein product [Phaeothamnion confervicola]